MNNTDKFSNPRENALFGMQSISQLIGPLHDPVTWYKNHSCCNASCTVGLPKQRLVKVDWYELLCVTGSCEGPI